MVGVPFFFPEGWQGHRQPALWAPSETEPGILHARTTGEQVLARTLA